LRIRPFPSFEVTRKLDHVQGDVLVREILNAIEVMLCVPGLRHVHTIGLASSHRSIVAFVEALDAFTLIYHCRDQNRESFMLSRRVRGAHPLFYELVSREARLIIKLAEDVFQVRIDVRLQKRENGSVSTSSLASSELTRRVLEKELFGLARQKQDIAEFALEIRKISLAMLWI